MGPYLALIFALILPGLPNASFGLPSSHPVIFPRLPWRHPVLFPHGPGRWSPHPHLPIVAYNEASGRAGENIGNIGGGLGSFTANVKAEWETQLGIDAEIEGQINSNREHEQLIKLADGGYIKDKDGLNWGVKVKVKPTFQTQVKLTGEFGFGSRRRRSAASSPLEKNA